MSAWQVVGALAFGIWLLVRAIPISEHFRYSLQPLIAIPLMILGLVSIVFGIVHSSDGYRGECEARGGVIVKTNICLREGTVIDIPR